MTFFESIILGAVQGIAEFLPISSTGHLILMRDVLGINTEFGLATDAVLHFATVFAVILYFRKDLYELLYALIKRTRGTPLSQEKNTLLFALVLGTVPAIIAGLFLEKYMDTIFRDAHFVAWILIAGSILFIVAEYVSRQYLFHRELSIHKGIMIGFFQTLALLPGMSRSGATISGGMILGLSREVAARFAFLLSLPVICGGGLLKFIELGNAGVLQQDWQTILLSACVAFIAGILSIHYLLKFLKNNSLYTFIVYRVLLALLVLIFL